MVSVFTKVRLGELPGQVLWQDDKVFALLTIRPIQPGHCLVVPVEEVDHWLDCPADVLSRLTEVSQIIGQAMHKLYNPTKVGLMVAGLEVPHLHWHLIPIKALTDLEFSRAYEASAEELEREAGRIRDALRRAGRTEVVG